MESKAFEMARMREEQAKLEAYYKSQGIGVMPAPSMPSPYSAPPSPPVSMVRQWDSGSKHPDIQVSTDETTCVKDRSGDSSIFAKYPLATHGRDLF